MISTFSKNIIRGQYEYSVDIPPLIYQCDSVFFSLLKIAVREGDDIQNKIIFEYISHYEFHRFRDIPTMETLSNLIELSIYTWHLTSIESRITFSESEHRAVRKSSRE